MIQYLRFNKARVAEKEFPVLSGKEAGKFFARRALYLLLLIYSTLFLAVAIPFVKTPCIAVYFIGSMVTACFCVRLTNHTVKFFKYKGGSIRITRFFIEIKDKEKTQKIPVEDITYFEVNPFGNFIIREKTNSTYFPLMLINEEDRIALTGLFDDMAEKRTKIYRKIWEFLDAITVALILAVHIIQFVIQAYFIPTASMEDTLLVGDHLFVEKITYGPIIPQMIGMEKPIHLDFLGIREVRKGDIIIFRPPHEQDKDYIKRCIAIPGDLFEIKDGSVFINGKKQEEPYTKGQTSAEFNQSRIQGVVPEGKVVVLGDNRENSMDGRYFGYLDIERIKGKAFILYWNTDQFLKNFDFSRFGLIR